ncbi:MAG: hypothetical protein WC297_02630 [Candidatus Paceibacterota bacterium]|jgi:hypothetical protein
MIKKILILAVILLLFGKTLFAEESLQNKIIEVALGGMTSYGLHEAGHYLAAEAVGGKDVEFGRFVTWNGGVDGKTDNFMVSSAGFMTQNIGSEIALSIQEKHKTKSYFVLGILLHNFFQETFYHEKKHYDDLHNMEKNSDLNEDEIRTFLAVKSIIDLYRFYHPDQKWSIWASRSMTGTIIGISFNFQF